MPKIRLSHRSSGYIEIKDGSKWRYVVEENWDKNRQKMLCQHLGFEETASNDIATAYRRSTTGLHFATGDLICYNTRSSETSCCVHLQPSTTTASITLPNAKCKYGPRGYSCTKISSGGFAFNLFLVCLHGVN